MAENINLVAALKKYFGFDTFKGNQEAIIRNLLSGKDTFVLMLQEVEVIMLSASFSVDGWNCYCDFTAHCLMKNQVDAMRNFSEEDGYCSFY